MASSPHPDPLSPVAGAQVHGENMGSDAVWTAHSRPLSKSMYNSFDCVLQVRKAKEPAPFAPQLGAAEKAADNNNDASFRLDNGTAVARADLSGRPDSHAAHERFRKVLGTLNFGPGKKLAVDVRSRGTSKTAAEHALYCAIAAGSGMPRYGRKKSDRKPPAQITLFGVQKNERLARCAARANANSFTRRLCLLPGNWLTPARLVDTARTTAAKKGLGCEITDVRQLRRIGAGAFMAVAGPDGTGGIVRISYRPARNKAAQTMAIVGKGVCYDTGGINLKPHKHMLGMHADMAGAAAALAAVAHAAEHRIKIGVDAWLTVADNRVFREAAAPGDVIFAANGTSIELVHSDAEGRLLLADTLHLCAKTKPAAIVSLATLTGSMVAALGERMSGVLGTDQKLIAKTVRAGELAGERLHPFPLPEDYLEQLDSKIADVKQCAINGDADHILAALFLKKFVGRVPWAHIDLAASSCNGGLGAISTKQTGFGAACILRLLELIASQ